MRDLELFTSGGMYHVYNRGVDRRHTFMDDTDRERFIASMIEFNDVGRRSSIPLSKIANPTISENPCVEIMSYCLMPNHFHMMLKQLSNGGVSEFMHRLSTGYTKYFNKRHDRTGVLFEGTYQAKSIETTGYARHLSRYIHLNPLELKGLDWKRTPIEWKKAETFLNTYRWSSYKHYVGLEIQPFVKSDMVLREFPTTDDYKKYLKGWVTKDWVGLDHLENELGIPGY